MHFTERKKKKIMNVDDNASWFPFSCEESNFQCFQSMNGLVAIQNVSAILWELGKEMRFSVRNEAKQECALFVIYKWDGTWKMNEVKKSGYKLPQPIFNSQNWCEMPKNEFLLAKISQHKVQNRVSSYTRLMVFVFSNTLN